MFQLEFTKQAEEQLELLKSNNSYKKRFKAVKKAFQFLQENPRHPSLNSHEWKSEKGPNGEKIWEVYAESNTPSAYRIFFCYNNEERRKITVLAITPHP